MNGADRGEHPIEAVSALIDGELRGAELEAVETHLAGCDACRKLAEDLRRIAGAIPLAAPTDLPADLEARIKSRLRDEPQAARRRRFVLPVAVAATLGAVALLAGIQIQRTKPRPVAELPTSVASPADARDHSAMDEVAPGMKQGKLEERADVEQSRRAAGSPEQKTGRDSQPTTSRQSAAANTTAKDQMLDAARPAAPPPPAAAPSEPSERANAVAAAKAKARLEHPDEGQLVLAPPPPPPPQPESPEPRFKKVERARQSESDDAKRLQKESNAEEEETGVPGGVVGGVVGGAAEGMHDAPASDVATRCPSPWRIPLDVAWPKTNTEDALLTLSEIATRYEGQAISGRDEHGPFVSLLVPAAAWPGILETLRPLGMATPSRPPSLPDGTGCVRLDVRTLESTRP